MWVFCKAVQVIIRYNINLIFAGGALVCPLSVILGRIFQRKVITQVFGLDVAYSQFFYQWVMEFFLPRGDHLVAISRMTKELLFRRGVAEEKIAVIHPGVESKIFELGNKQEELKEKYGFGGKYVILSLCRLAKRKGIAEFIRYVLPEILKEIPNTIYLIVGGNPLESLAHRENVLEDIKRSIAQEGFSAQVKLFGAVDHYREKDKLIEIYNLCDLFVLPVIPVKGDLEGFGIVFLEANAAGKATVGSRIGGIPDAIEDGKSGVLIAPRDYREFSRKIISLLKDPKKRTQMGDYGRKMVQQRFDWNVVIAEYLELFKKN
jgi:phosphatidylinositol alpha-1,6-mannosyltransferase